MIYCRWITMLLLPLLLISPARLLGAPVVIDFNDLSGVSKPWNLKIKEGKAYAAVIADNGMKMLLLKSLSSSFAVERDLSISPQSYPCISWSWKAIKLPLSGDVRKRGYNDQALQILIAFENGKVISYVWDSNAPEGTIMDESIGWPVNLGIKVFVVKSGTSDTGKWITHTRNLWEDYMNMYGEPPPHIKGIRIQMNTQYTKDSAEGLVREIRFSRRS